MQAMIDELAKQAAESLGQVSSKETLASFWQEYLSKNGKIPALMKNPVSYTHLTLPTNREV